MNTELLYAKDAIFRLIRQFHHAIKFDDGELYIYDYAESALEHAFNVLGIDNDYIKLIDFCKIWEDNSRAIWAVNFPNEPYGGITAKMNYAVFEEGYKNRQTDLCDQIKEILVEKNGIADSQEFGLSYCQAINYLEEIEEVIKM